MDPESSREPVSMMAPKVSFPGRAPFATTSRKYGRRSATNWSCRRVYSANRASPVTSCARSMPEWVTPMV